MFVKYICIGKYFIEVITYDIKIFDIIYNEIGSFFKIEPDYSNKDTKLGTIKYCNDNNDYMLAEKKIVHHDYGKFMMHNGSFDDDLRNGKKFIMDERMYYVFSDQTKSIFKVESNKNITVYNRDIVEGAKDIRRLIRNQIFIPYMQSQGGVVLHAAAVSNKSRGILIVGGSGSGKTTVFLSALTNGSKYQYLSCERILIFPEKSQLKLFSLPETISILPGTLSQFDETNSIVDDYTKGQLWLRTNRLKFGWRELLSSFSVMPGQQPIFLERIIFPHFSKNIKKLNINHISDQQEIRQMINRNIVCNNDNSNIPNWLNWYKPSSTAKVLDLIIDAISVSMEWCHVDELELFFRNGIR